MICQSFKYHYCGRLTKINLLYEELRQSNWKEGMEENYATRLIKGLLNKKIIQLRDFSGIEEKQKVEKKRDKKHRYKYKLIGYDPGGTRPKTDKEDTSILYT